MNKQSRQKFLTLFNDMLSDQKGLKALETVLQNNGRGDEVDALNAQKERELSMRLDQRNILFLKKVAEAKQKILDGTYGQCEDCGTDISQKRLLARPTATLCISCQEEKERAEFKTIGKRRDLSEKKISEENSDDHIQQKPTYHKVSDIAFESVVDL